MSVAIKPDVILVSTDCNANDDELLLRIKPQSADTEQHIQSADTIDITVGDESFDKAFHIEAAPTEIVRAVLDERTRKFLLAHPSCHLDLVGRELQFLIEHLSESELEAAILEMAHAAAHAENVVKTAAANATRPTDRDGYRDSLQDPAPDGARFTALARTKPLTLAARELRHLRELRDRGHFIGSTIVVTGGAYVAALIGFGGPWAGLLLTPVVAVVIGIAFYFVLSVVTEVTGIATLYRRWRLRNLNEPQ